MVSLSALLSPDNHFRAAAEAELERLRVQDPTLVATALITALAAPGVDESERAMAAVLSRRLIPSLLPHLPSDAVARVKAGLLEALINYPPDYSASMHRKLCNTVGRLAAEFHSSGTWPELSSFVQSACGGADQHAHATALTILEHMAPAIVSAWHGEAVQALCVGGLTHQHP